MFNMFNAVFSAGVMLLTAVARADILHDLPPLLSPDASVTANVSSVPRWSDYHAPRPAYIVNVVEEQDVATTVGSLPQ
jgi:hypothetical protein